MLDQITNQARHLTSAKVEPNMYQFPGCPRLQGSRVEIWVSSPVVEGVYLVEAQCLINTRTMSCTERTEVNMETRGVYCVGTFQ